MEFKQRPHSPRRTTVIRSALALSLLLLQSCGMLGFSSRSVEVDEPRSPTPGGVLVSEQRIGVGAQVKLGDLVSIDYRARLTDGTEVDSSWDRGVPLELRVGEAVIAGWNEGLLGMRVGGERLLEVPPEQAYGAQGVPGLIPPDATLLYEIELVSIAGPENE